MTARSRNRYVNTAGSEPDRILQNSRAVTTDSMPLNEVQLMVQCVPPRRVSDLSWNFLDVLLKQAGDRGIQDRPQGEGICEWEQNPEMEWNN